MEFRLGRVSGRAKIFRTSPGTSVCGALHFVAGGDARDGRNRIGYEEGEKDLPDSFVGHLVGEERRPMVDCSQNGSDDKRSQTSATRGRRMGCRDQPGAKCHAATLSDHSLRSLYREMTFPCQWTGAPSAWLLMCDAGGGQGATWCRSALLPIAVADLTLVR